MIDSGNHGPAAEDGAAADRGPAADRNLTIRTMRAADIEAVIALETSTPGAPNWTRSNYDALIAPPEHPASTSTPKPQTRAEALSRIGLVAEIEHTLQGFAVLRHLDLPPASTPDQPASALELQSLGNLDPFNSSKVIDNQESTTELESILVGASSRRRGIGKALMKAAIELARQSRSARLELEVRASNAAALQLYSSSGLHQQGRRPRYYSAPEEDAILMAIDLPG
ncbi:MAG TPA: GNAT family N-acetyltransferase [Acidisarcina sp.]